MGQDKKQLTKLLAFVNSLYEDPDNKEFAVGIRAMVLSNVGIIQHDDVIAGKLNDIYELCIRQFLKEEAEDMYKDFPIPEIAQELSTHYIEMENARRKNNIDAFGFYLYKQLELITNILVKDENISAQYGNLRTEKPFIKYDKEKGGHIRVADKYNATVEEFVLNKNSDNKGKPLDMLSAKEKIKAIIYLVVKKCEVDVFHPQLLEDFKTVKNIYTLRNKYAHARTDETTNESYIKIVNDKTHNSLKYLSFLLMFIKGISENYSTKASSSV